MISAAAAAAGTGGTGANCCADEGTEGGLGSERDIMLEESEPLSTFVFFRPRGLALA